MNDESEVNAAPLVVKCVNDYDVAACIFDASRTLANIKSNLFIVKITQNPKIYADALYGNPDNPEFAKDDDVSYLKNSDAYFICLAKSIEEANA